MVFDDLDPTQRYQFHRIINDGVVGGIQRYFNIFKSGIHGITESPGEFMGYNHSIDHGYAHLENTVFYNKTTDHERERLTNKIFYKAFKEILSKPQLKDGIYKINIDFDLSATPITGTVTMELLQGSSGPMMIYLDVEDKANKDVINCLNNVYPYNRDRKDIVTEVLYTQHISKDLYQYTINQDTVLRYHKLTPLLYNTLKEKINLKKYYLSTIDYHSHPQFPITHYALKFNKV